MSRAAGQPARAVVLPVASPHGDPALRALAPPGAPALPGQPTLPAPDLRLETPRVGGMHDAGVAAVADGDLADVHVDTGHGPVVRALHGGDGVAVDRHPLAVDALERGLHGFRVRVRVAAPAQPEPAQSREVQQPVVPDADVPRGHASVSMPALT